MIRRTGVRRDHRDVDYRHPNCKGLRDCSMCAVKDVTVQHQLHVSLNRRNA